MKKITLLESEKKYLDRRGVKHSHVSIVRLFMRLKDENEIAINEEQQKVKTYEYYV